jgi:hypothetical protein
MASLAELWRAALDEEVWYCELRGLLGTVPAEDGTIATVVSPGGTEPVTVT